MSTSSTVSSTIMSDWDHVLAYGIAQYDTDADSLYPFIETGVSFEPPALEDPDLKDAISGQSGKWRWFPLCVGLEGLKGSDIALGRAWLSTSLKYITEAEEKRAQALKKCPLASFRDIKQLDFTGMNFSEAEIVERVNAVANPTIINLKGCQISDEAFKQMRLPKSLKKLILTHNPLTEKSLRLVESAKLDDLEVLCAAHTLIAPKQAMALKTDKLSVFV